MCNNCIHKPVCGKFAATGGHVRECEHFKEVRRGRCDWCEPGKELCGTCQEFFDYYGDGGSDKCSACLDDPRCSHYNPVNFCPNCGADMRGDIDGD